MATTTKTRPMPSRDKSAPKGAPVTDIIGHDDPPPPYPMGRPAMHCGQCGGAGIRVTPCYFGPPLCGPCGDAQVADFDRVGWPRPWWEAPPAPHVAVACSGGLFWGEAIAPLIYSVAELGEWCEAQGITQVWVHESAFGELGWPAKPGGAHAFMERPGDWKTSAGRATLSGYSKWWKPKGYGFTLHVPAYENDSAFADAESGYRLLCDVAWYEHATRGTAPWMGGGSITSDAWIRRTFRSRRRSDLAPSAMPEPLGRAREARWYWSRPAMAEERSYRLCHALDLNLAYAAVASSLPLPVGECVYASFPTFDKRVPGLWLIEPEPWTDPRMPAPWADDARRTLPGPYWVTTPTMERCAELGVEAIESWTWPEHHAYLRPWYELIRDARAELLDVGGAPLAAVKEISRRGVGRLASRTRTKALDTDELYQPYWTWAIIAECRARLHRRLSALEVAPVAIDTDAVYFLSSRSSPEALAVRLGLPLGEGLGQFKPAGTCSAADARAALAAGNGAARAIGELRKLMKP